MDITRTSGEVKAYKYLNGETVNYTVCYFAVSLLFIVFKQLFKVALGISAGISAGVAAAVAAVVLFILEKKFVFNNVQRGKTGKQILLYLFRCAVDFGFYKIATFVFVTILENIPAFAYFITFFIYLFFNYYFDRLIVFDCVKKAQNNKNGRAYKLFWDNRFVLASMLFAFVVISILFLLMTTFPFGDTTVLRMDLYHQYGPLFCELYDRVMGLKTFNYSWISGGGSSFIGNYFNYLSSPLSAIILLFDRKEMPYAITTIVAVKGILCAGTFTYYIKKSLDRHSFASACFGVFYAFSAYFLAYYWNVMWLDGMFLLPLVTLGIERIINEGKPVLYIASLTVLFYSTYYMAYMTCIFSVVYFVCYFILKHGLSDEVHKGLRFEKRYSLKKFTNNRLIYSGLMFAGASVFAALLCAVALIPVYLILQNSAATSDSFPKSIDLYQDLLNIVTSHLAAVETTIRSSGEDVLPNIYCGVLGIILLPLYVINKKISVKEKAVYILLLLFFIMSFNVNVANFIWHAFHYPNDLPFRFSFMYIFVFLIVAFRALEHFKAYEYKDIAFCGLFWIFMIMLLQKYMTNKMGTVTIYMNIVLIMLWTAFLLIIKNGKYSKTLINVFMVFFVICECALGAASTIPLNNELKVYTENYNTYREAIDYAEKKDDSLYRFELSKLVTRMDSCLYGYRGISTFSSMAYETYSGNQYTLGMFGNRINSYTYNTQTPIYNMLYGIKYINKVEESLAPSVDYYEKIYTTKDEKCELYENKYYLPLAFTVPSEIKDAVVEEGNPFEVQEDIIDRACGTSDVFIPVEYVSTEFDEIDGEEVEQNGTYYFTKSDSENTYGTIDITIKAVNNSNLYVYITSPKIENVNYYYKGKDDGVYQNIETPYIMDLGKHRKGDEIRISIDCGDIETDSSYFEIYAYNIDYDKVVAAHELLSLGAMDITSYSDTHISGKINAGYNGMLYTSIPFDKGWEIYIDGEKLEPIELYDCQLACNIKKGEHTVEFKYTPQGLIYGLLITCASWGGVVGYFAVKRIKKRREEKAETV